MNYWEECISEALEDAGLTATQEQIGTVAVWVEGAYENYGMVHGHDSIPIPILSEVERLQSQIERIKEQHEKQLYGVKKGVALRRNVSVNDVHIKDDGHVMYDSI